MFLYGMPVKVRAAGYDDLWKQVKEYERKDLPKSAYKIVEQIAGKADKEHQQGQRMAALLYGCKLRQQVVPDSFYTDMLRLERLKSRAEDEVERAVLASVLGELYETNQNRNRNYNDRTDAHPDSIREWSQAQFLKAAAENYRLSMARPEVLAAAKAADYLPFVERGKDAAYFNGDLLNVIGRRAVGGCRGASDGSGAERNAFYAGMLSVYRQQGNREAELLLMIDSVGDARQDRRPVPYAVNREQEVLQSDEYKTYRRMLSRFGDMQLAAEIYVAMLDLQVSDSLKIQWIEEGYAKYKRYPRSKALLNEKMSLEQPWLSLSFPAVVHPELPFDGVVEHRNLSGMELQWYRLPGQIPAGVSDSRKLAYVKKHGRLQKTERLEWEALPAWKEAADTFRLSCPGVGYYAVVGRVDGVKSSSGEEVVCFPSTRLEIIGGCLPDSTGFYTVVDGRTGQPVPQATVEWWSGDKVVHTSLTDAEGKVRWREAGRWRTEHKSETLKAKPGIGEDKEHLGTVFYVGYMSRGTDRVQVRERLYTDRSIYRPGQTVYVGGWCTEELRGEETPQAGRKVTLTLLDPNGKSVAEQTAESDGMGTFSVSFTLPSSGLSGTYAVRSDKGRVNFTMEEYRRPTFEVRLDDVDGHYRAGDTLYLTGEAMNYNGVPLRGGRVTAKSSVSRWAYLKRGGEDVRQLDTVYTDEKGRFVLPVPVRDDGGLTSWRGVCQMVEVAVLGASGETQTAWTSFPLTKEGLQLSVSLPDMLAKDSLPGVEVQVKAASGAPWTEPVALTCDIYRVPKDQSRRKVLSGISLPANRTVRLAELSALPSGNYELAVRAVAAEDTAELVQPFHIFSLSDTRPADRVGWFYAVNDTVSAGRPGWLKVGSAADSVSLYYMLFARDRLLEERFYQFSDSILNFTYPEIPEGEDGLQGMFYFMKDGTYYSFRQNLVRKHPDRSLRFSWVTFRDRLQPGTEETWRLRVTLPDGRPAPAQLMSVLYDASLDGIRPHQWTLQRYFRYALPQVNIDRSWWYGGEGIHYSAPLRYLSVSGLSFDRFSREMMFGGYFTMEEVLYSTAEVRRGALAAPMAQMTNMKIMDTGGLGRAAGQTQIEEHEADVATADGTGTEEGLAEEPLARMAVRDDLRETAFFYPRLMADSAGVVTLHFTLPEGLTTWKFMALAHTEDMHAATFTDRMVAQKEVMAQLNLPRFVRLGDRAALSVSLFNLTQQALDGKVTMEVFDPATEQVLWKETRNVGLAAERDSVVSFVYEPKEGTSLPACRVLFEAGGFTDGEQRYLPVLEDKEWLTQTRPFVVSHQGDTVVRLDGLFQNNHRAADHRRLTVEYTSNPLWYAVQALPTVLQPRTEDVLSLSAAYYATVISSRLAGQYPQVKTAAENWRLEGGEATESPLATQEDLTGIVLEETPWVAEAESGTARAAALQQLFDANRQADLRQQFAASLGKLQRADGSFSWFGGMSGNAWLTRRVARLLLRSGAGRESDKVLEQSVDVRKMMQFLTDETHKDIQKDKEYRAEHQAYLYGASYWLDQLYLMNLCDASWMSQSARQDAGYMLERLVEGMHGLAMADKAEAAVVLQGMGRSGEAAQLVGSLREHLVDGAEGLHLEYPSNGFVGSDRKMAVHVMIMEALSATGEADKATADGLCRWLLAQKRVQDWGTSTASMDAVHALMQGQGEDLTLRQDDRVRLASPKGETWAVLQTAEDGWTGLGTVSATVEGRELDSGAGVLEVTKTQEQPSSWGAAYAQFRLPLSEVGSAAEGLRVRLEADKPRPSVGDRLTLRYIITADRDYEYVRLKAGRAACLEPVEALSGYEYRNGLGYYKEVKDASTQYFFERLPKGTYVLEMECYVERPGRYTVGAARLNGVYAPEFSAYDGGLTLEVQP